ncbi:MAG: hypothetical protein HY078_01220 [Elusimicrobia bacterium]|nr:hypothetical protein [Elusimicrobiota bacterium]
MNNKDRPGRRKVVELTLAACAAACSAGGLHANTAAPEPPPARRHAALPAAAPDADPEPEIRKSLREQHAVAGALISRMPPTFARQRAEEALREIVHDAQSADAERSAPARIGQLSAAYARLDVLRHRIEDSGTPLAEGEEQQIIQRMERGGERHVPGRVTGPAGVLGGGPSGAEIPGRPVDETPPPPRPASPAPPREAPQAEADPDPDEENPSRAPAGDDDDGDDEDDDDEDGDEDDDD